MDSSTPLRSFSGTHPFRPTDMLEQLRVENDTLTEDELVAVVKELMNRIDQGWCPRCESPLPTTPELPTGSRVTACRCIPICGPCGVHEAFYDMSGDPTDVYGIPWWGLVEWINDPPDRESVIADIEAVRSRGKPGLLDAQGGELTLIDEDGVGPVSVPGDSGGWAQFGDEGNDEAERAGR